MSPAQPFHTGRGARQRQSHVPPWPAPNSSRKRHSHRCRIERFTIDVAKHTLRTVR